MSYGKPFFMKDTLLDVGWATFTEMGSARATRARRVVVFENPFKTSQMCPGRGAEVENDLSERWYSCNCDTELDRDTNAALTILKLGHKALWGGTRSTSATA
jgi:putative transposase